MNRVVMDAELRAKLNGGRAGFEFVDEAGNVVGHFVPDDSFDRLVEALFPPVTKEEIAEARAEMLARGGVSTAELLTRLEKVRRDWEARQ